jgi:hypothetical protein
MARTALRLKSPSSANASTIAYRYSSDQVQERRIIVAYKEF